MTTRLTPREIQRVHQAIEGRITRNLTALIAEHGGPDVPASEIPDDVVRRLGFTDLAEGRRRLEEARRQWLESQRSEEGAT